ncbi:hypothetical protein ACFOON_05480 [Novosphingobium piscinae]|uniref:Uncharacterized protein n=1 Tax=Novosphingobium piscinae TaxID=1507448 RepID=A0A7X1FZ02_9SPHN|nr:hypothetical protein [Novosphingobium piscinae]MBC2669580.1 hypothetical protein [Novosphingobium piscinae]
MIARWPARDASTQGHDDGHELALTFDRGRAARVLVLPALFDEGNRLRRFTVEAMRALDAAGIDSVLPDLPGTNESLAPLDRQSLTGWRTAAERAAHHFAVTHVLAIRGAALVAPALPGWAYAPLGGAALLRQMVRARLLAAREAGRTEQAETLLEQGRASGLELAGYRLGPALVVELGEAIPADGLAVISQADIGGAGLWLRAEPDENAAQSAALAARIAAGLAA